MANVRRVYAEKKAAYAVRAEELMSEIKEYLNIQSVTGVRVLVRYDVENVSEDTDLNAFKLFSIAILLTSDFSK